MFDKPEIRNMTRSELDELVDWAARGGWNPGLHDADLFWTIDSEAFLAAEVDGEMIGGGAITSYNGKFTNLPSGGQDGKAGRVVDRVRVASSFCRCATSGGKGCR
jgi:hypothetical protein